MDEQHDFHAGRRGGECTIQRWSFTGARATSLLKEESSCLGSGEKVRVGHPSVGSEHHIVPPPEGVDLHAIEDTNVTKNLLDPVGRPGVKRQMLNADFDMTEPRGWPGTAL
jgi:hypothetical protein